MIKVKDDHVKLLGVTSCMLKIKVFVDLHEHPCDKKNDIVIF